MPWRKTSKGSASSSPSPSPLLTLPPLSLMKPLGPKLTTLHPHSRKAPDPKPQTLSVLLFASSCCEDSTQEVRRAETGPPRLGIPERSLLDVVLAKIIVGTVGKVGIIRKNGCWRSFKMPLSFACKSEARSRSFAP